MKAVAFEGEVKKLAKEVELQVRVCRQRNDMTPINTPKVEETKPFLFL